MTYELFGSGKDWQVFQDSENNGVLIKEPKNQDIETSTRMAQRLLLGQILHILFPQNLPKIFSVSTETGKAKLIV